MKKFVSKYLDIDLKNELNTNGGAFKMSKAEGKKPQTDNDVKKKAVKHVISHLKKKIPEDEFSAKESLNDWITKIEEILKQDEVALSEYVEKRKELNEIIERVIDDEFRFKLRDSWYSLGKAMYKKAKVN